MEESEIPTYEDYKDQRLSFIDDWAVEYARLLTPNPTGGLNEIQQHCIAQRIAFPGELFCERGFRACATGYLIPMGVVYMQFHRLVQQISRYPLFMPLANYDWLAEFPVEPAEILNTPGFSEFLNSLQFPEFSEFGSDMFRDVGHYLRDDLGYMPSPIPVRLPIHVLSGTCFHLRNNKGTNVPPHNLSEIIGALLSMLDGIRISENELSQLIQGPDFPQGGSIWTDPSIPRLYRSGKGLILHKCKAVVLPQTQEGNMIEFSVLDLDSDGKRLAASIRKSKMPEVISVSERLDRIVVKLVQQANPELICSEITKLPDFPAIIEYDSTFLIQEKPKRVGIGKLLEVFIDGRINSLMEIHGCSRIRAVEEFKQDLCGLRDKYGYPRQTQVEK